MTSASKFVFATITDNQNVFNFIIETYQVLLINILRF